MNRKGLQNIVSVLFVIAVLFAGTVSARQLSLTAQTNTCRGKCSATMPCSSGCICAFPLESTTGTCSSHPTGVQPAGK